MISNELCENIIPTYRFERIYKPTNAQAQMTNKTRVAPNSAQATCNSVYCACALPGASCSPAYS